MSPAKKNAPKKSTTARSGHRPTRTTYSKSNTVVQPSEAWDPLETSSADAGVMIAVQRREITNILKSYTGYYDLFSELIQNSLDAVDRRTQDGNRKYVPKLWITIDMQESSVAVMDNGCGMTEEQFRNFLRPNFSFKDGRSARGSKGVGATYLAYGFNHLEAATRAFTNSGELSRTYSGLLSGGRDWVDDRSGTVLRPKVAPVKTWGPEFDTLESGTFMKVRLSGENVRPRDLAWLGATTAEQWLSVLRSTTPLGGIFLCEDAPPLSVELRVIDSEGRETRADAKTAEYLYPHLVLGKTADLREFLAEQKKRAAKNLDTTRIPPKFTNLNGIWGEWTGDDILTNKSPLVVRLDSEEQSLVRTLGMKLYCFLGYSTDLWDAYNDDELGLRKNSRLLRGGLQLATRNMPQGLPITIPLTNNIGFQNIAHVVIHFDNAEPDLGRKGFQPEHVQLAGKVAVSAVTAFRRYFEQMLRKSTGAPALKSKFKLEQWIDEQKEYEKNFHLS